MVSVSLLRNYAKVTVGVDAGVQGFTIGGYGGITMHQKERWHPIMRTVITLLIVMIMRF